MRRLERSGSKVLVSGSGDGECNKAIQTGSFLELLPTMHVAVSD